MEPILVIEDKDGVETTLMSQRANLMTIPPQIFHDVLFPLLQLSILFILTTLREILSILRWFLLYVAPPPITVMSLCFIVLLM